MKILLALLTPLALAACATSATPQYDLRFGDAVREARQRQALNAGAAPQSRSPDGLDGKSAHDAITLYQNTFKAPPPVVNVINIGGPLGGGR